MSNLQADVGKPLKYVAYPNRSINLQAFREKIGTSNFDFNTIRASLDELSKKEHPPKVNFAVSWCPSNLSVAIENARSFSSKAFLVYAVDALDLHMRSYSEEPVLILDPMVSELLRGDLQYDPPHRKMTNSAIAKLRADLADNAIIAEKILKEFQRNYLPRPRKPGVGERFAALSSCCPTLPKHYYTVVRIMISWRNRSVHRSTSSTIDKETREQWLSGLSDLAISHPKSDSVNLMARYDAGDDPSPDDLITMVALTHRTLRQIDTYLIENVDLNNYIESAIRLALRSDPAKVAFVKRFWGYTESARAIKILGLTMRFGFHRTTRKNLPPDVRPVPDEVWLELARLSREEFERYYFP